MIAASDLLTDRAKVLTELHRVTTDLIHAYKLQHDALLAYKENYTDAYEKSPYQHDAPSKKYAERIAWPFYQTWEESKLEVMCLLEERNLLQAAL